MKTNKAEIERKALLDAQAKAVIPLIAELLDTWDGLVNEIKTDPELEQLRKQIELIDEAMEHPKL